jgi:ribonuclease I
LGENHADFWAHEWEKHGTCCAPLLKSQMSYFNKTVDLRMRYDPGKLLSTIQPSSKGYSYDKIFALLSKNGVPTMRCRQHGDAQLLVEVVFCITASPLLVQFDCTVIINEHTSDRCHPSVPILLLPPSMTWR